MLSVSGWLGLLPLEAVIRLPRPRSWTEHTAMDPQPRPAPPALHSRLAGIPARLKVSQACLQLLIFQLAMQFKLCKATKCGAMSSHAMHGVATSSLECSANVELCSANPSG